MRLQMVRYYRGGITYEQLQDGELFEEAYTFMVAQIAAEKIVNRRKTPARDGVL
jgi:hypothetical protein